MPVHTQEVIESLEMVEEVLKLYILDPVSRFKCLKAIGDRVKRDDKGKTSLIPHIVYARRKAVMTLLSSRNYDEVANMLGISPGTVRNDVRAYYDEKKKSNRLTRHKR